MLYNQAQVLYLLIAGKDLNAMLPSQVQHSEWHVHLMSGKLGMICLLIPLQNEIDIFTHWSLRLGCPHTILDIATKDSTFIFSGSYHS